MRAVDESSIRRSCSVLWSPLRSAQYHMCSLCRERGLQPRQRPAGARRTGPEIPAPHIDKFCQNILTNFVKNLAEVWQRFAKILPKCLKKLVRFRLSRCRCLKANSFFCSTNISRARILCHLDSHASKLVGLHFFAMLGVRKLSAFSIQLC